MLFFLLAGHALMDYSLQNDAMAACKCRRTTNPIQQAVPWYYWLTAHALLHGAAVGVIIQWSGGDYHIAVVFGLAETVIHWFIDLGKCERLYGIHIDQGLHVLCKVVWWGLFYSGTVPYRTVLS
jgi:hypothetical protein